MQGVLYVHTPDAPMARVLKAVCRGSRNTKDIARQAEVDPQQIRVYLRRLKARGLVRCERKGSRGEWHLQQVGCLLSEIWS